MRQTSKPHGYFAVYRQKLLVVGLIGGMEDIRLFAPENDPTDDHPEADAPGVYADETPYYVVLPDEFADEAIVDIADYLIGPDGRLWRRWTY